MGGSLFRYEPSHKREPLPSHTTATIPVVVEITTTIIMTIDTVGCVLVSLLFRGLVSGSKTLDFDCGIDLSSCGIAL